jgi:hypothetical protein
MRSIVTVLVLASLLAGVARAQPPSLSLVPDKAEELAESARTLRATGIGLFVGGVVVAVGSHVLTAMAIAGEDQVHEPFRMTVAGAVTVVAGNAMLAAGLALWSIGNRKRREARALGFAF